jgi:hypothetical protein
MRNLILLVFFALLAGCENSPVGSSVQPVFPALPASWIETLGEPRWRLEWIGEDGSWQEWEGSKGSMPGISLPPEWTTPVLAWPFWPSKGLTPGMMRPSGAFFPWDTKGDKLCLDWVGGVEAFFWKEMALADRPNEASDGRLPWYFDWPRFRELLESENIPIAVRQDLWLADWKAIAGMTVKSGFDRRRIKAQIFTEQIIPGLDGRWIGSSPFAPPLDAPEGGPLKLLARDVPDTWVSSSYGILKCASSGWVLIEF